MRHLAVVAALGLLVACGPQKVVVDPAIAARATLDAADANLRAGCFDCLVEALKQYESVRAVPVVADVATMGAVRASTLLALREREMGTTDSGYLERARQLAASNVMVRQDVIPLIDVVDALPWRGGLGTPGQPERANVVYANRVQRLESLRAGAARDELSAYIYAAYACESGAAFTMGNGEVRAAIGPQAQHPLLAFRLAICAGSGLGAIDRVAAMEPRYKEIAFYRGLNATSARKLDDADARYREAYAWRETWPAVTLAIANVAMTGEEFAVALEFYDRTLTLAPRFPDALLGKLRTLSYLTRHQDAIGVADELIAIQRYPGDAYYWRAFNELSMERYDPAWTDIELADRSLINSDVPKLAGIIAINRQQLDVSRQKLELSRQRNPNDCQTLYYLHLVLAEQRQWPETVRGAVSAAGCIDAAATGLRGEIETIRASDAPEARKARQIAAREQQVAAGMRMRVTCWYNAAVGSFNLAKKDEAKEFAEKIADDEQFGQRARDLLTRLK